MQDRITAMADKMSTQLRVRGDGLADVAAKAGRKLPKHLRADAAKMIEAATMPESDNISLTRVLAQNSIVCSSLSVFVITL